MTSIIIAGKPNSEEMSECIIVAENIANLYPSTRFTLVLKSPYEWEAYCEDLCNLFGIKKKSHPLILFSNGTRIGGRQEFFKLIYDSFKQEKVVKREEDFMLDINKELISKLTQENTNLVEKEYVCRTKGHFLLDKIRDTLQEIKLDNFNSTYSKYNTISTDYEKAMIEDMKVYVKYNEKFTPETADYTEDKDFKEERFAYPDKEAYVEFHEKLRREKEEEERKKREAEEAIRAAEREAKLKAEEEERARLEALEEAKNKGKKKNAKKEREKKKKEEEARKKAEEEARKKAEEEEAKKKAEEEEAAKLAEEEAAANTEAKEEEQPQVEKKKEYKRISFTCYRDFDIPINKFDKEILVEKFPGQNFDLIINPYFTFYGETILNPIKEYEARKLPEREIPVVEEEEAEQDQNLGQEIKAANAAESKENNKKGQLSIETKNVLETSKITEKNKKSKGGENITNSSNNAVIATEKGNVSGREGSEGNKAMNSSVNSPQVLSNPPEKPLHTHNPDLPTTYEPNFPPEKEEADKITVKDLGKIPSLRIMKFEGIDLQFYIDWIPPYQLAENIENSMNLKDYSEGKFLMNVEQITNVMETLIETNGYATYKVLPDGYQDWKWFSSNKIKILPELNKDIKNEAYPLTLKIEQQVDKYRREKMSLNRQKFTNVRTTDLLENELLTKNPDFHSLFHTPEYFELDLYKKNGIKHIIKYFNKDEFNLSNIKLALKEIMLKLEISNTNGYGFVLIMCQKYIFAAPIKEPYAFTKESRIPIFAEPYYFMGIFTLPTIESEWPESVQRKNVKFDLIEILKKTTN